MPAENQIISLPNLCLRLAGSLAETTLQRFLNGARGSNTLTLSLCKAPEPHTVCGFVIQAPAGNIFFAGDTAMGSHFTQIKNRFGEFRLALLPIGAYLPGWFMHPVHLTPAEAVKVDQLLRPSVSVAIHFGTFALGDDGEVEPVRELQKALGNQISIFWVLEHGEGRDLVNLEVSDEN